MYWRLYIYDQILTKIFFSTERHFFHLWQSLLSVWLKTLILDILDTFSLQSKNGFILLKMTCFFYPSIQTNRQPNWKYPLKSKFEIQNPCRNQLQEYANLKQQKNKNWKTLLKTVMAVEQWNLLVDNSYKKMFNAAMFLILSVKEDYLKYFLFKVYLWNKERGMYFIHYQLCRVLNCRQISL